MKSSRIKYSFVWLFAALLVSCVPYPQPPRVSNISAIGLEVTQSIQDLNNDVVLIAGKRTFVRVYIASNGTPYENIAAKLEGFAPNGDSLGAALVPANTGGTIDFFGTRDRRELDNSFYFELPFQWIWGGPITLRATINPNRTLEEVDYDDNVITSGTITFQAGKDFWLRFVEYSYKWDGWRIQPDPFHRNQILSLLWRMYPIALLHYTRVTVLSNCGGGTTVSWPPKSCRSTFADSNHPYRVPWPEDIRAILLGLQDTYEPKSPGALYFGLYALPSGLGYATLGQAWPDDEIAVGWTHPDTTDVGDTLYNPGRIGVHEIGHLLGLDHVLCKGTEASTYPHYPYPNGIIGGPSGDETRFIGFDSGAPGLHPSMQLRVIPWNWADMMSYCDQAWISDFYYTSMFNRIQARSRLTMHSDFDAGGVGKPLFAIREDGDYLSVYGAIDTAEQTASIAFISRQPQVTSIPPREAGPYSIRLFDEQGMILADYPFTPRAGSDQVDSRLAFGEIVPFIPGARRIALVSDQIDAALVSLEISPNPPVVSDVHLLNNGELPQEGLVGLSWDADDPDEGDSLTYTLLYSFDNRRTWRVLATGIDESNFSVDVAQLEGTETGYFRVVANDGVNTSFADSQMVQVANKSPVVSIASPGNTSMYTVGQAVTFEGFGQDIEDGTLGDAQLVWQSDRDGMLGTGHLIHPILSQGTHVITLTAVDYSEQSSAVNVVVTINP